MDKTKKLGRPTTNPRNKGLNLRMSEKELELLNKCSNILNKSRIDTIILALEKLNNTLEKE